MRIGRKKTWTEQAMDGIESAVDTARDRSAPLIAEARELVDEAREKAVPALAEARDRAVPAVQGAVHEARERTAPAVADARDKAAPVVAGGAALAAGKAKEGRARAREVAAEGRARAAVKAAELRGEPAPKSGSKVKKLLLLGLLAGVIGAVVKKVQGDRTSSNWQSSYVPAPAPTPGAPTPGATGSTSVPGTPTGVSPALDADETDDHAGSSPDEELSDAAAGPHGDSTPDDPAEVVELDDSKKA